MFDEKFDNLKRIYSRADKYSGDIAVSSHEYSKEQFKQLTNLKNVVIGEKKFTFTKTEGQQLKDFWTKQGGHFQYCIAPKLRMANKLKKAR